ncbi:formate dehydrogenase, chloroplastic/mitochondrial-like [Lathyrus oleraceus]|uniref:formate dehydrogenase, chloroplastic/mitochondrial-like n=1 Tax=Pisum sativum TaxID=3888 RepID=UPI0021D0936E|nr:formate dehydrogenase, chloroplastic/mitochondrial-like [Pisum sativum]
MINLPCFNLSGTLSHSVANLGSLVDIRLEGNHINGVVPSNWTSLMNMKLFDLSRAFLTKFKTQTTIPDLHVLISTPFHPAYVTAERIKKAKNLELLLTAGIGSDHIDLNVAAAAGLTVAEVTGSNIVFVAEDELMRILILVRNFVPGYHQSITGEWDVAGIAHRAYDLEGKTIGMVGAGRIGKLLLQRLKPFNCNLLYHDRLKMKPELEKEIGAKFEEDLDTMLPKCDVIAPTKLPDTERWLEGFATLTLLKCFLQNEKPGSE